MELDVNAIIEVSKEAVRELAKDVVEIDGATFTRHDLKKIVVKPDPMSQMVTQKAGIQRLASAKVPNPAVLAPFRTFREVFQPQSSFLVRLKGAEAGVKPALAIFETDGGAWKQTAVEAIKRTLNNALEGTGFVVIG